MTAVLAALGASRIVVGHTRARRTASGRCTDGRVLQIDTGMLGGDVFTGGAPSALEIQAGTFTAIYPGAREVLIRRAAAAATYYALRFAFSTPLNSPCSRSTWSARTSNNGSWSRRSAQPARETRARHPSGRPSSVSGHADQPPGVTATRRRTGLFQHDLALEHVVGGRRVRFAEEDGALGERDVARDGDQVEELLDGRAAEDRRLAQQAGLLDGLEGRPACRDRRAGGRRVRHEARRPIARRAREHAEEPARQLDVVGHHGQQGRAAERQRHRRPDGRDPVTHRPALEQVLERQGRPARRRPPADRRRSGERRRR